MFLNRVSMINNDSLFQGFWKEWFYQTVQRVQWRKLPRSADNLLQPLLWRSETGPAESHSHCQNWSRSVQADQGNLWTYGYRRRIKDTWNHHTEMCQKTDSVIYLEGEKFLIFFYGMKHPVLKGKLEEIRSEIQRTVIPQHPAVKLSISIGGYFSEKISINDITKAQKLLDEARLHLNYVVVN